MVVTRAWTGLAARLPAGGGLRDEDRKRRHRLLTLLLAGGIPLLTMVGALQNGGLDAAWFLSVVLVLPCVIAASVMPGRRLASVLVALGFVALCGGFVAVSHGLTEAHFAYFVVVAALALYRDWAPFGAFLAGTVLHHSVLGALLSDRTYGHHSAQAHPLKWALLHGLAVLAAATFQVISWRLTEIEEKRAQVNLDESQAQMTLAFDETPVPMVMWSPDGRLLRANDAYFAWMRLSRPLPADFRIEDLPITAEPGEENIFGEELATGDAVTLTRAYRRTDDGSRIWVEIHSNGLRDADGRLRLIFLHCLDVTGPMEHRAELQRQVRVDSLTGLLSRRGFEDDLVALLGRSGGPVGVIYLDVDRFKAINDGAGHAAGDDVLRGVADRLGVIAPAGSLIGRLGGDEFVVGVPGPMEIAAEVARSVVDAFGMPLPVAGNMSRIAVSVGVAGADRPDLAEHALLAADTAMYAAKKAGGNRLAVFNEQMRVAVKQRITSEADLRRALDGPLDETLPVWFQPIASSAGGRILGAEALVRMRTPDGKILGPGHFIPAAEETGLVVPLGEHVMATALRWLMNWRLELGYVSVNVSPRQLSEPGFVPMVARLLAEHGLDDPSRLVLEITETAVLSLSDDLQKRLDAVKALGVRIALDDFGTGYSSLTWLQSVPADVVKLDRSFVSGLAGDVRKSSIIVAVLGLATSLNMTVVAEGVEEPDDWRALAAAGCPAIQGYLVSRPVPPREFQRLLWETPAPTGELLAL
ncbi:EAL domain-containing protein [Actinoplanes sp. NPDC051470]|uniref:putative bifunctional diguanylate cyclase/phosphodiesterase n=1 Tax=Actinoplanes sp. NPDC051470 TaxID=3157224 RepID=UPI0034194787